ncbi:hypothetical protein ACLUEY_01155 [Vreelandella aquamarina]
MSIPHQHPEAAPQYPQFRFVEFSKTRQLRATDAALVEITYGEGDRDQIWMAPGDLHANIRQFGEHDALTQALAAYGKGGRV